MVKIFIDGKQVEAKDGSTILKAAEEAGIQIPHLCYHPAFAPEGSCRMCMVEIEGLPKLELSCSTLVREGLKISTTSPRVIEARKSVLEFLLAEHPLDCPICDKAGECKLQDYYEEYGFFESQFKEEKEKKSKKVRIGKNLILDQERCVLCTRCVRFLREITKSEELGVFERGVRSVVDIYEKDLIENNYSGNLVDLCPGGAITDVDFRFKTRTWFLRSKESICPLCSRGCNIFIQYHPGFPRFELPKRVYRIKPRENPEVNGFWICDQGRYGYSYLDENRLFEIVQNGERKQEEQGIVKEIAEKIRRMRYANRLKRVAVILNCWLSNEELFLAKKIFCESLKLEKVFFVDPPLGKGDDYLLTEDRSPNRRGAKEIGFSYKPLDFNALQTEVELLVVFGPFLTENFILAEIKSVLDKIETKILFTFKKNDFLRFFETVLPTAHIAEKEGSLVNVEGKVQIFNQALEPRGKSLPEWKILLDLAKEMSIDFNYYRQFSSPQDIRREMAKEIPFFENMK